MQEPSDLNPAAHSSQAHSVKTAFADVPETLMDFDEEIRQHNLPASGIGDDAEALVVQEEQTCL